MAYLNTYNLASQALEVGNVIALGANDVQFSGCCNGLSHAAGTGIINVKAPGVFEQLEYDCSEIEALKATKSYLEKFTDADFAELIGGKDAWLEALRTIDSLLKA